jgi:predicted AAA+ superfamily ATPase
MCGKTWTGKNLAASSIYLDEGDNLQNALLAPELTLAGDAPRLVDEWQLAPALWDKARRMIDESGQSGCFIFTGSAVPASGTHHTGTGRFMHLAMKPLTLYESGVSSGAVSLSALFRGEKIEPCSSSLDYEKAIRLICKGGWPAALWLDEESASDLPGGYLKMIIESDISRVDGVNRSPARAELLIRSLARNNASQAGTRALLGDMRMHEGNDVISEDTIDSYVNALKQIFVIEDQEAWLPALRSKTRIRTSPKRHFTDPSLAAAALGATVEILLKDTKTSGFLFESLCYRDLTVYAQNLKGKVYHYRDEKDLEADAVIQLPDGKWGALEVKMGSFEFDKAAKSLLKLKQKMEGTVEAPQFLAILSATGGLAYTRPDGVLVVPLDCLGP